MRSIVISEISAAYRLNFQKSVKINNDCQQKTPKSNPVELRVRTDLVVCAGGQTMPAHWSHVLVVPLFKRENEILVLLEIDKFSVISLW